MPMRSPSGSTRKGTTRLSSAEEQIDQRQHESEQRGDADQLREELAGLRRKNARGDQSPKARGGVHGDGARGIVDGERQLKHFDQQRREDAGDEADEDGLARRDDGGAGAGSHQAGQPAVGAEAGVGLAEADAGDGKSGRERARRPRAVY